ncbi:DUF1659 domain-containing protein [Desulfosporosinus sp. PR]|uniref:DUF1659 domain-containing protein n=1 Tax=Candidatus Desulfosporosinus nitrosoreducens TaxID=3401928 RepID=UPI0027FAD881|nr:DUF1659 domain-containing protein [Desulfosporosinus sp. PR]MDQ7094294.1 DUF1659 domain-containing protein [Desulfosporosinus sp. PR]
MAVNVTPLSSAVIVKYQTGTTPEGSPVFKQKTLNNVLADAPEQDIHDVAMALFSLIGNNVTNVYLRRNYELIEE